MAISVKQKIRSGTLFLFLMLVLSAGVGLYYLARLKNDARMVLRSNYESIDYSHAMQRSLDSLEAGNNNDLSFFGKMLAAQESNVTEPGEETDTRLLRQNYEKILTGSREPAVLLSTRQVLGRLLMLNMAAIEQKNQRAMITADQALTIITVLAAVIILIGISFTYNFPSVVTAPVTTIIKGIEEVGRKNYGHRIHLDNRDEFGQMANALNTMAERLEYFESSNLNRILFEKSRAEAVINSLRDASMGIDQAGQVLFANEQALQLLGLEKAALIGKQSDEIASRNDLFRFLLQEKDGLPFKVVLDNHENYFVKEMMEIPLENGGSRVIILRNITSFRELDVAKTNFIATISHELKTPLASTDFSIRLLEDDRVGSLSAEQKELVTSLRADNQRMLRILSELLNLAQVESGKIQLDIHPVDPAAIAGQAMRTAGNAAREKGVRLELALAPVLPVMLADADKTGWVLNNFLANAIRFSPVNAEVQVSVREETGRVIFEVKDNGPGIPEEYQHRIFDRFFTVPGSSGSGTGIGLSIAREFIEAQLGSTWVRSEPGKGSVFGFDLPVSTG